MKTINKKYYIIPAVICLVIVIGLGYYYFFTDFAKDSETKNYVYIDDDDTADSVFTKLEPYSTEHSLCGFKILARHTGYTENIRTGRFSVAPGISTINMFRNLRNGHQEAQMLTIPESRTMDKLAGVISRKLMLDSLMLERSLTDNDFCGRWGYDTATIACLFVPNTYDEVCTVASIIDEETANNSEKPMVAGMYLNRLKVGMPLQADPTIKFAMKRFELKRIYHDMLFYESPYNTYQNIGLPPGPIKIASIKGIDAVLNRVDHEYIYMCAKEDFSGTHNFAKTYSEHLKNAAKYSKALNERGIK